jgi:hypothetical protein
VAKIRHFGFFKRSQATWSRELLGNFPKKLSHFWESFFEIVKTFGGFG